MILAGSSSGLASITQGLLDRWVIDAKARTYAGRLPDYIPLLAKANPQWVAIAVTQINGSDWEAGDRQQPFALMSVIKPFLLLFLLEKLGFQAVFSRVGMEPSDQPFHSLAQLRQDRGFPRNPMINSGALVLASLLPGEDGATCAESLRLWLNLYAGSNLVVDQAMLASVRSLTNEANSALANFLAKTDHLASIARTLDTYNHICCLSGTVTDLAKLGLLLVRHPSINPVSSRTVSALMMTCGLYEASGRFAVQVGLPTKSGVSGALLSVVPGQGAIACYSPAIDQTGNSIAGLFLLEQLAQTLSLSIFA